MFLTYIMLNFVSQKKKKKTAKFHSNLFTIRSIKLFFIYNFRPQNLNFKYLINNIAILIFDILVYNKNM